jgi:membrane protein implicated in regulation of membrane protease activity
MRHRRWSWWAWALACLVGLAALAAIILAVWKLPSLLYGDVSKASADARLQAASGFRTALVAGLAGLAALGSLAMATRTYRLTQQGQINERYTKAIEQLGSDGLDVRLGGIYALERIATDSERDHPTVVEVLSAFVREHSHPIYRWRQHSAQFGQLKAQSPEEELDAATKHVSSPAYPLPEDVQAAVTVLGRLPQRRDVSRGNLDWAHLRRANLGEAHLERAHLLGTHLEGADLDFAYLLGTVLKRAHLEGAALQHAHLEGCTCRGRTWRGRCWAWRTCRGRTFGGRT